jgi:hypothetical protein
MGFGQPPKSLFDRIVDAMTNDEIEDVFTLIDEEAPTPGITARGILRERHDAFLALALITVCVTRLRAETEAD